MPRPQVVLDLASDNRLAKDLAAGGVFVPGCKIRVDTDCELILKAGARELRLPARIVFVDPARGAGVEIVNCTNEVKEQIAALARTVGIQAPTMGGAPLEKAVANARKNALFDDDIATKPPPKRMNTLEGEAIIEAAHAAREAARGKPTTASDLAKGSLSGVSERVRNTGVRFGDDDERDQRRAGSPTPASLFDERGQRPPRAGSPGGFEPQSGSPSGGSLPEPQAKPRDAASKPAKSGGLFDEADLEAFDIASGSSAGTEMPDLATGSNAGTPLDDRALAVGSRASTPIPFGEGSERRRTPASGVPMMFDDRARTPSGGLHFDEPRATDRPRTPPGGVPIVDDNRRRTPSGGVPAFDVGGAAVEVPAFEERRTRTPTRGMKRASTNPDTTPEGLPAERLPRATDPNIGNAPTLSAEALGDKLAAVREGERDRRATLGGEALADRAAAARASGPNESALRRALGIAQPTITGDALAERAAAAREETARRERSPSSPPPTPEALAAQVKRATRTAPVDEVVRAKGRRYGEDDEAPSPHVVPRDVERPRAPGAGQPTITGDALAERAAEAKRAAEQRSEPTVAELEQSAKRSTRSAIVNEVVRAKGRRFGEDDEAPPARTDKPATPAAHVVPRDRNRSPISAPIDDELDNDSPSSTPISATHEKPSAPHVVSRDRNRLPLSAPVDDDGEDPSSSRHVVPRRAPVTGQPTITGDALAELAAEARRAAGSDDRQQAITGQPTMTGDALAEAAAAAARRIQRAADDDADFHSEAPTVTGDDLARDEPRAISPSTPPPTITGDALAEAAAAAARAVQQERRASITGAPTITGDALAEAAAAATRASERSKRPSLPGTEPVEPSGRKRTPLTGSPMIPGDARTKRLATAFDTGGDSDSETAFESEAAMAEETAEEAEAISKIPGSVHERLRGLTTADQIKIAQTGDVNERVVLERLYGKNVWEALLRNPRLSGPEVARIARMGALPRTLLEIIVNNAGWLHVPEVRRALLANPRLGTDQIQRVLRLLPKPELKLAAIQTAYPFAVRDAARRLLREAE